MAVIALAWLVVVVLNVVRLVGVTKLEDDETPETRAWVAWGLSVAALFSGCCTAIIAWVVIEWILKPLDPFEDSLGTVQLYTRAKSNISFIIVTNIIMIVAYAMLPALMEG